MGWLMQDKSAKCCSFVLVLACDAWLNCCVSHRVLQCRLKMFFVEQCVHFQCLYKVCFMENMLPKDFIKYIPCQDCHIKWTVYRVEEKYWMTDLVWSKILKHCVLTEVGCQNPQHTAQENLKMCPCKIETLNKAFLENGQQVASIAHGFNNL